MGGGGAGGGAGVGVGVGFGGFGGDGLGGDGLGGDGFGEGAGFCPAPGAYSDGSWMFWPSVWVLVEVEEPLVDEDTE